MVVGATITNEVKMKQNKIIIELTNEMKAANIEVVHFYQEQGSAGRIYVEFPGESQVQLFYKILFSENSQHPDALLLSAFNSKAPEDEQWGYSLNVGYRKANNSCDFQFHMFVEFPLSSYPEVLRRMKEHNS